MELVNVRGEQLQWLVDRTHAGLTAGARGLAAVDLKGRIRGMVVYDGWTENAVQAHMAVDIPIAWRTLLPHVFEYPFKHVEVLIGVVPADNRASWRMVDALGFELQHVVVDGWRKGVDLLEFEMRKSRCRWLRGDSLG